VGGEREERRVSSEKEKKKGMSEWRVKKKSGE
jgi:hypothetical protein